MRLPWGDAATVLPQLLDGKDFVLLGCLSFESRCEAVPLQCSQLAGCRSIELIEVVDPSDGYPYHWPEAKRRIDRHSADLAQQHVTFFTSESTLLADEDDLVEILSRLKRQPASPVTVLDISSLPKRYFCFLVRRLLSDPHFTDVIVTYTQPGAPGYTKESLAEDPMSVESLPGFASRLATDTGDTLVVSVGFEALRLRSLLEVNKLRRRPRLVMSFPPDGEWNRRQWQAVRQMMANTPDVLDTRRIEVVATWDAEQLFNTLERWGQDSTQLSLAPFGPKPHSLAMAAFATRHDLPLYYTQPKSYHPDYSLGASVTWAYVVKWGSLPFYSRRH